MCTGEIIAAPRSSASDFMRAAVVTAAAAIGVALAVGVPTARVLDAVRPNAAMLVSSDRAEPAPGRTVETSSVVVSVRPRQRPPATESVVEAPGEGDSADADPVADESPTTTIKPRRAPRKTASDSDSSTDGSGGSDGNTAAAETAGSDTPASSGSSTTPPLDEKDQRKADKEAEKLADGHPDNSAGTASGPANRP